MNSVLTDTLFTCLFHICFPWAWNRCNFYRPKKRNCKDYRDEILFFFRDEILRVNSISKNSAKGNHEACFKSSACHLWMKNLLVLVTRTWNIVSPRCCSRDGRWKVVYDSWVWAPDRLQQVIGYTFKECRQHTWVGVDIWSSDFKWHLIPSMSVTIWMLALGSQCL